MLKPQRLRELNLEVHEMPEGKEKRMAEVLLQEYEDLVNDHKRIVAELEHERDTLLGEE